MCELIGLDAKECVSYQTAVIDSSPMGTITATSVQCLVMDETPLDYAGIERVPNKNLIRVFIDHLASWIVGIQSLETRSAIPVILATPMPPVDPVNTTWTTNSTSMSSTFARFIICRTLCTPRFVAPRPPAMSATLRSCLISGAFITTRDTASYSATMSSTFAILVYGTLGTSGFVTLSLAAVTEAHTSYCGDTRRASGNNTSWTTSVTDTLIACIRNAICASSFRTS